MLRILGLMAVVLTASVQAAEQSVFQDYHLSVYRDAQQSAEHIELFTKMPDREVFFGIRCSSQSPFPMLEVLLFNDEVMSELPRLLQADYRIDGQAGDPAFKWQAVLKPHNTFEEVSNRVRIELDPQSVKSMNVMQEGYQSLLENLKQGEKLEVTFSHRALGKPTYAFSLRGLKKLLEPYQDVCK
ncbi:hypothetical protein QCB44_10500 [Thiomicrorhabdus sp. zzn3]|uniref:hypothetical protein n=1 Tax=Thiomicrorhabdus sp. zzn3 TaxID=3039775 RepID=UPI002436BF26|nr:hypothetical protein [Thiomicrorhabdus sp. zzn3]MDG6779135.1 hypothetical protein [Thiomicrorhabdus sp. zzn3]